MSTPLSELPDPENVKGPGNGWEDKVWGKTKRTYLTQFDMSHRLIVEAGSVCSIHMHEYRVNQFVIRSGAIKIVYLDGLRMRSVVLKPGVKLYHTCPARQVHQFQVLEDGELNEYYSTFDRKIDPDDIVRYSVGTKVPEGRLKEHDCFWDSHGGMVEQWDLYNAG